MSAQPVRRIVKAAAFAAALAAVSPLVAAAWLEKRLSDGEQVFVLCAQMLALAPGLPGALLRAAYYFGTLDRCSWEVHVGFGSVFTHRGAALGRHASMGSYCVLGHAWIGEEAMIGSRVSVPSGKGQHLDAEGRLSTEAGRFERVAIGEGCWIGEGAIVLADVGRGCIVAAGAVVSRPMPDGHLVAGNPAQAVRPLTPTQAAAGRED